MFSMVCLFFSSVKLYLTPNLKDIIARHVFHVFMGGRTTSISANKWNAKFFLGQKSYSEVDNLTGYFGKKSWPGDSIRDQTSPPGWRSLNRSKGHVFTHHPKKVTYSQNCQIMIPWLLRVSRFFASLRNISSVVINHGVQIWTTWRMGSQWMVQWLVGSPPPFTSHKHIGHEWNGSHKPILRVPRKRSPWLFQSEFCSGNPFGNLSPLQPSNRLKRTPRFFQSGPPKKQWFQYGP